MDLKEEQEYVLGTHDEELIRLGFQHRLWGAEAFALWERAGFAPGQTILDLGCGPGYASFDLAALVGERGRVMAVDASARFIEHLRVQQRARGVINIEAHVGDVHCLELAEGVVDSAYARWVLCFVSDPEAVVAGIARALRPGGVLAIQDYFNYRAITLAPRSAAFDRVITAVDQSWRLRGGDPDIVGRLPAILQRCGLTMREIRPIARVARPGSALWNWPTSFFRNYVPTLVEMGLLTADEQRAFEQDWAARSCDSATFFCTPPMYDVIATRR
jgi:SAM-dependent methyltransferase